jgi:hypothetical protein
MLLTGSLIADDWIHWRPHQGAGQSIPLLAGARVQFRRRRQTSVEPASLDLAVLLGVIPRLVLVRPLTPAATPMFATFALLSLTFGLIAPRALIVVRIFVGFSGSRRYALHPSAGSCSSSC